MTTRDDDKLLSAKRALRRELKARLVGVAPDARIRAGAAAANLVQNWEEWPSARGFLSFLSLPSELDTTSLNRAALEKGKILGLPRIDGQRIVFHRVEQPEGLLPTNRFGIREPSASLPLIDIVSGIGHIVVVPGIAFDRSGRRLGRGKGYYDRYLAEVPEAVTVGLCFDFQVIEQVPAGPHDRPVSWLLTETRIVSTESRKG
jgi:5-formyltetrahydrofolate cyclo-ligase